MASTPSAALEDLALEYPSDKSPTLHALLLGDGLATSLANLRRLELTLLVGESLEGLETIALKYADSLEHLVIKFGKRHDDPIPPPPSARPNSDGIRTQAPYAMVPPYDPREPPHLHAHPRGIRKICGCRVRELPRPLPPRGGRRHIETPPAVPRGEFQSALFPCGQL
ncbi:hypothetical protein DFH09DRAFT_326922 [Mycena vulgaris]|nr:hypothetical protein DFH09DRAFT_326922 [Mycena vulgaris]